MATGVTVPRSTIDGEALEQLRATIRGTVAVPGDELFGAERAVFNTMHASSPDIVVTCTGTADVIDAVNFAREQALVVTVRGGGHSIAGLSAARGGMLIDLAPMNGVEIDPTTSTAVVQGGALWGDVDREAQAFGLATPGGVVSDTGVAGLTLGGGYGWIRRKHGLSCDNLISARIVCADGQVRTASADENPDLFWALRGGGGNFGIVTSFTFKLHELGPIVAFAATFYPVEDAADILRGWRAYAETAPDEVTSVIVTITFPADPHMPEVIHNRAVAIVGGVYAGDADEGMKVMQPLRELGTPLFDMSQPMPFTAVQAGFDPLFPRDQLQGYWKSLYLNELSDEAIDLIAAKARERPAPLTMVNTFLMGGAIASVGPEDTAFSEREPRFLVSIDGLWDDPAANAERVAWIRQTFEEIGKFGTGGIYLNFTGLSEETVDTGIDSAFGRNLRRLAEVKAKYDPTNFFRVNNNITPAS